MTDINEISTREMLPTSHRPYTDKYFLRTNVILKKENINPFVTMKVFCRSSEGGGFVPEKAFLEVLEVFKNYSPQFTENGGEIWMKKNRAFSGTHPFMAIKGRIQDIVELETIYLGILSHRITNTVEPNIHLSAQTMKKAFEIYFPTKADITYFGARHYHWSLDTHLGTAALANGATQTSTDAGSSSFDKVGTGTIPHVLVLMMASKYGKENATLISAKKFNQYMSTDIPRVTLVDTFNKEITDTLSVAKYFTELDALKMSSNPAPTRYIRLDTCGENLGETCSTSYTNRPEDYEHGRGVSIELARKVKMALIENRYNNFELFLTSSMGNPDKARAFTEAHKDFKKNTGYNLFTGVGIGELYKAKFCTADIVEVDGKPLAKTGREIGVSYDTFEKILG